MFDPTSRYYEVETAKTEVPDADDGTREVRYVKRRKLPEPGSLKTLMEHTVTQSDRLDNITARYLGDPTLFWRVCDANNVLQPEELEETGRMVKIAMPKL